MAKAAKSGAKKVGAKKGGRKAKRSFAIYIKRAFKAVKKDLSLSSKAVKVINGFATDMFDKIATEAAAVARVNGKRTLGSAEIQTAVRLLLPAELAKHAIAEAARAVGKVASA